MSLRNVVVPSPPADIQLLLQRIIMTDDAIETMWVVQRPDGSRSTQRVMVSPARFANFMGRTAIQNFFDDVRDDTSPRVQL